MCRIIHEYSGMKRDKISGCHDCVINKIYEMKP